MAPAKKNKKVVASNPVAVVDSVQQPGPLAEATTKEKTVNLTLKGLDKRGRNAIYTGAAVSLRFPIGAFHEKTAPATLDVSGVAGPKEPKPKMTAEERKAARAAQPKLTLAEKVARAEERAAKLREKLAAQPAAV